MYQRQVSFGEAVNLALTSNYCRFSGRSSRSEYWWFNLFGFILSFVIGLIGMAVNEQVEQVLLVLVGLGLLLPSLGLSVRRLHDVGKSGWWLFISLIPIIGSVILLVFYCQDSQPYDNEWGPVPNMVD